MVALFGLLLPLRVHDVKALDHAQCRLAGMPGVLAVVERRVPERHDRVTHIFVDGASLIDDRVGEWR